MPAVVVHPKIQLSNDLERRKLVQVPGLEFYVEGYEQYGIWYTLPERVTWEWLAVRANKALLQTVTDQMLYSNDPRTSIQG